MANALSPETQETIWITPDKASNGSAIEICPANNAPPAIENVRKVMGVIPEFQRGTVFNWVYIIEVAKTVATQKKAENNQIISKSISKKKKSAKAERVKKKVKTVKLRINKEKKIKDDKKIKPKKAIC